MKHIYCAVCGRLAETATDATFEFDQAPKEGEPTTRSAIRILACKPCIGDIGKVADALHKSHGLGFYPTYINCLRAAWLHGEDPVPSAIERMVRIMSEVDSEN